MQATSVSDGYTFTAITGAGERVRVRLLSIDAVEGFTALLAHVEAWPDRVWPIEGCDGSAATSPHG